MDRNFKILRWTLEKNHVFVVNKDFCVTKKQFAIVNSRNQFLLAEAISFNGSYFF